MFGCSKVHGHRSNLQGAGQTPLVPLLISVNADSLLHILLVFILFNIYGGSPDISERTCSSYLMVIFRWHSKLLS